MPPKNISHQVLRYSRIYQLVISFCLRQHATFSSLSHPLRANAKLIQNEISSAGAPQKFMYQFFKIFLIAKAVEFRRMVWKTRGEMAVEDLQNQAWIVADEIGKKRGRQVDFTDPHEQSAVMAALYVKSVKYREKTVQYAVRIDEERPGDDGSTTSWAERLPARETSDPWFFCSQKKLRSQ